MKTRPSLRYIFPKEGKVRKANPVQIAFYFRAFLPSRDSFRGISCSLPSFCFTPQKTFAPKPESVRDLQEEPPLHFGFLIPQCFSCHRSALKAVCQSVTAEAGMTQHPRLDLICRSLDDPRWCHHLHLFLIFRSVFQQQISIVTMKPPFFSFLFLIAARANKRLFCSRGSFFSHHWGIVWRLTL